MRSAAAFLMRAVAVELRMAFAALEGSAALNMVCCCMVPLFYTAEKIGWRWGVCSGIPCSPVMHEHSAAAHLTAGHLPRQHHSPDLPRLLFYALCIHVLSDRACSCTFMMHRLLWSDTSTLSGWLSGRLWKLCRWWAGPHSTTPAASARPTAISQQSHHCHPISQAPGRRGWLHPL